MKCIFLYIFMDVLYFKCLKLKFCIVFFRIAETSAETSTIEIKQMLNSARELATARHTQLQHVSDLLDAANAKVLIIIII